MTHEADQQVEALESAAATLIELASARRLDAAMAPKPSPSPSDSLCDPSGEGHSDPTGNAVAAALDYRGRNEVRFAVRNVVAAVGQLGVVIVNNQPAAPISPERREQMARANAVGCESHARVVTERGNARRDGEGVPTDLDGRLPRKMVLCRVCKSEARRRSNAGLVPVLPPVEDVEREYRTGKWPRLRDPNGWEGRRPS